MWSIPEYTSCTGTYLQILEWQVFLEMPQVINALLILTYTCLHDYSSSSEVVFNSIEESMRANSTFDELGCPHIWATLLKE